MAMLTIPPCFFRISVKALVLDPTRTKFLLVQEDNGNPKERSSYDGFWELPGGGLDWGEETQASLVRELREEMGLEATFVSPNPCYFVTFQNELSSHEELNELNDGKSWRANIVYEVELAGLNFTPSQECVAIKFVTPEEALTLRAFSNVHKLAELFDTKNHEGK